MPWYLIQSHKSRNSVNLSVRMAVISVHFLVGYLTVPGSFCSFLISIAISFMYLISNIIICEERNWRSTVFSFYPTYFEKIKVGL
jgi:hypothetical protein